MTRIPAREAIDDVGRAIIAELQQDGRRPYATIGQSVGLSEAAVRQRVQKLISAGVMQIVAVTDPTQLGFYRQVMIGLVVEGDTDLVSRKLEALEEIDYIVVTAGSFDIICEAVVTDDDHLLRLINRDIRSIPEVRRTETFIYLKLAKQTYNWGARVESTP